MAYIYKTTNLINGKTYIGQCVLDVKKSNYYIGSGMALKTAIKKYGKKNFKKEIIVEGNFNQYLLDELETHYIRIYSPPIALKSYNIQTGGSQGRRKKNKYAKMVYQWDLKGNLINTFYSTTDAANTLNLDRNVIYRLIYKRGKSCKLKCVFKYTAVSRI